MIGKHTISTVNKHVADAQESIVACIELSGFDKHHFGSGDYLVTCYRIVFADTVK